MEYSINSSYKKGLVCLAGKRRYSPRGCTLIFSIYIGWADFWGVEIFYFNIYFGFSTKTTLFLVGNFCGYFLGVTSKLDYFYGLLTKINYCYLCSVMEFTVIHTKTTIKHDGQGT